MSGSHPAEEATGTRLQQITEYKWVWHQGCNLEVKLQIIKNFVNCRRMQSPNVLYILTHFLWASLCVMIELKESPLLIKHLHVQLLSFPLLKTALCPFSSFISSIMTYTVLYSLHNVPAATNFSPPVCHPPCSRWFGSASGHYNSAAGPPQWNRTERSSPRWWL